MAGAVGSRAGDVGVTRIVVRDRMRPISSLEALAEQVTDDVYLRYSRGPMDDHQRTSRDYESGLQLPGLSVVPLAPPAWWGRPVEDWLARQVCRYLHLREETTDQRYGWLIRGRCVGRGPDNEPLVGRGEAVAWLTEPLLDEARRHYHEHFDVAQDSTDRD
jgi:hypothetical protein